MWQLEICRADGLALISPPKLERLEQTGSEVREEN
jgi:hypothetical protein